MPTITIELTDPELALMWLAVETIREANPDDADAIALDTKVTAAVKELADRMGGL